MITFLKGELVSIEPDNLTLDVGGVGYTVFIPKKAINSLPPKGSELQINTFLNLREDGATLYGFISREELSLFKNLISVTGIGPKVAINILGATDRIPFVNAIFNEDITYLTKLPGVGKKTAQRLIIDLKDKLQITEELVLDENQLNAPDDELDDALQALIALGYQKQEIMPILIKGAKELQEGYSTQDLIRFALKDRGKAKGR